ncbi:MAG: extracellular solute-binding protein [Clostridiales bacterium]|nr:extracellular solute-binding protein [Clostridiales bacterium]
MFKRKAAGFMAALMCASLVGCGGGETKTETKDTGDGEAKTEASADDAKKEDSGSDEVIKIALSANDVELFYGDVIEKFEAETGKDVETIEIPQGADMYTKITMMMQSPETCPDVIAEDGFMIMSDAKANYLEPLDDMIAEWEDTEQFNEAVFAGGKGEDGVQYGIPYSTDVQCIWYDKQLMEEAGVPVPFEPKTWDDIIEAGKKIKALGDDIIPLYIFASKAAPEETSMRTFQEYYAGTGGSLYDFETGKWIVDKENLLKVFNFVNDIFNVEKIAPPMSDVATNGIESVYKADQMQNHKLGMISTGSWTAGDWGEGGQSPWPEWKETWAVAKIPTYDGSGDGYATMSGGWTWAIPKNANNKEGGKELLKFLANKENQVDYALYSGNLAVRKDVMEDPAYTGQDPSVINETSAMLDFTHFRPSVEGYATLTAMFTEVTESVALGAATPEEAVETFESEMKRIAGEDKVTVK